MRCSTFATQICPGASAAGSLPANGAQCACPAGHNVYLTLWHTCYCWQHVHCPLTMASAIQFAAVVEPLKTTTTQLVFQANSTLSSLSSSNTTCRNINQKTGFEACGSHYADVTGSSCSKQYCWYVLFACILCITAASEHKVAQMGRRCRVCSTEATELLLYYRSNQADDGRRVTEETCFALNQSG